MVIKKEQKITLIKKNSKTRQLGGTPRTLCLGRTLRP
jgi:hypothetical protein